MKINNLGNKLTGVAGGNIFRSLAVMSSRTGLIKCRAWRTIRARTEILCIARTRFREFNFGVRTIRTRGTSSIFTIVPRQVAILSPRTVHECSTRNATKTTMLKAERYIYIYINIISK